MFDDWASIGTTEKEIEDMLSRAKLNLFLKKGAAFVASILSQTEFVWDMSIPTAATNGLYIKFNPKFFLELPQDTRVTVLAHEIWHIAYEHVMSDRIGTREPEKWNEAADHVINIGLEDERYSFIGVDGCLKDRKYSGMGTEQVYSLIPDKPKGGNGKKPNPNGAPDMGNDIVPLDESQGMEVKAKIIQAVQAARMADQAGDIPGEITLALDKFLNPKLPWEVLLRRFFTEQANDDYSWRRPNRRYDDVYLPSLHSEDGLTTINYYLDISGSVSDADIHRFNSEVAFIKNEYNPEHLNLITFDTKIRDTYHFGQDEAFEKIVVTGRGGTDLRCVNKHILAGKPNVAVIFSDLWVDPMASVGSIPVLWIVIGNPNASVPFGQMVHIDSE
jgi:predicted metal-dependent peptidase